MISEDTIGQVLKDLFQQIEFQAEPAGLYDPLRYMVSIGGKRLRPRLCLTAYGFYKDAPGPEILQPAAGLEVFHTFTLIHDDIMDRSPLRRGHETVWKKWNQDTAILSGDVMFIDACHRMAQCPKNVLPAVLDLFFTTARQVMDGQQLDMDFEQVPMVPMQDYMKMVGLKTAVLLACSAKTGALIAGAPTAHCQALYDYAYDLGLAFQVADDYLDAYGDEKVFGKPIGGDIVQNKKSWLIIKAYELAPDSMKAALSMPAETPGQQAGKIAAVKAVYDAAGIPELARTQIAALHESALGKIRDLAPEAREVLEAFARKLVGRTL